MADVDRTKLLDVIGQVSGQYPDAPPGGEGIISDLAGGAIEAVRSGIADLPLVLQKLADAGTAIAVRQGIPTDRITIFKRLAEAIEPKDFQDKPSLARKIGHAIGGVATAIPKYAPLMALGPAMIPAFGAVEGLTAWGREAPTEEIVKRTALGTAFGGMLKGAGALARWPRAGALATGAPALEAVAMGGEVEPEDLAITGLTMGTLGMLGGRLPHKLSSQLAKLGYPREISKTLDIKTARKIVRERTRFQAKPSSPSAEAAQYTPEEIAAMPGAMRADPRELEAFSFHNQLQREAYIINKALESKGFTSEQIVAMPDQLKTAMANSGHDATSVSINKITGGAIIKGPEPKLPPTMTEQVMELYKVPYKGPRVEDLAITTETEKGLLDTIEKVTSKIKVEEKPKVVPAEKFEALRDIRVAKEKGEIGKPVSLVQTEEGLLKLPPAEEKAALLAQLEKATSKLRKAGKTDAEIESDPHIQFLKKELEPFVPFAKDLMKGPAKEAQERGKNLTYNEAVARWKEYLAEKDSFKRQLLREEVEGFLGYTGRKSLTREQIVDELSKRRPKKKAKISEIAKEVKGVLEAPEEGRIKEAIALGWPIDRLRVLDNSTLDKIVIGKLTPENASITATGKLVEITKGDAALATILGTTKQEAAEMKEAIRPEIPLDAEATLRAAADWAEMSYKSVEKLTGGQKQLLIETYLDQLDKNAAAATKVGEKVTKAETEAAKMHNEVIAKDPEMNTSLVWLEEQVKAKTRKAQEKERLYKDDLIDKADWDIVENEKLKAIQALEAKRAELTKKSKAPVRKGGVEKIGYIVEKGEGGLIVRKRISDTMDEFSLLTKEGRPALPDDTGVTTMGTVKVEMVEGKPTITEFPTAIVGPLKQRFVDEIKKYYNKQGRGLDSKTPTVTLRTGVDADLLKEMAVRTKNKMVNIYQGFAQRRGPNKSIPRDEMPEVMRDAMAGEKVRLTDSEIKTMYAESIQGIVKGETPRVEWTTILGQAIASRNPDIVAVQEQIILNELRKRYLKQMLVWDKNSKLNTIFKKINEQPDPKTVKALREEASESLMYKKVPNNPLVAEAVLGLKQLRGQMADTNDLSARGFFINEHFPLIVSMENTYKKIQGMFKNIHTREDLPERYKLGNDFLIEEGTFKEIKYILDTNKSWDDLNRYAKNRIRYDVLQFEGIYDEWAFLPEDVMGRTPKKTFNPHLQPRKGGQLLAYKHDAYDVYQQYLLTMVNKEADTMMLQAIRPIINKYPREDIFRSARWYMSKQAKQALGTATIGQKWISNEIARLNDIIGREVLNPNFATHFAGRLTGQVARGALGPDTALRNLMQSMQTLVNEGPGPFAKGLYKYVTRKGITPDEIKFFKLLLEAEEYHPETGVMERGLGARLARAETKLGKVGAFYNWLGDMALSPMRATEHFNKFLAFQSALSTAAEKGWSFEKGVRLGLLRATEGIPDLLIPHAYFNAFKHAVQSQYGYSRVMRSPITRGPLAKISTIFWSYPANTIQFITRGLIDSTLKGDLGRATRFGLYAGFQISIATAMAQLGLDVGAIWGQGLLPVKAFSIPWDVMKNAYIAVAGKTAADRSSGSDDFLNALGMTTLHQFRYGKKVLKQIKNLQDGYMSAGTKELAVMETSPFIAMLDLMGFPPIGPRETYDLVQQLRDRAFEYGKDKQDLVLKGIKALDAGKMEDVRKIFETARERNIALTSSELSKYYRLSKTKTYLQTALERLPKHLREPMAKRIKELEEELMPHRMGMVEEAGKSMWSGPSQYKRSIEEIAE